MTGYTREELFTLWRGFREEHDATRILMDFALCSKNQAQILIDDFEVRYESQLLNLEQRGKER